MALIFLDLETTGLDPRTDRILELAAARVSEALEPVDGFSTVILPNPGVLACPPGYVYDMHTRNGLLAEISEERGVTLSAALQGFTAWLAAQPDTPHTLAGNSVHFDLGFLREWMQPAAEMFSHRLLDVTALQIARRLAGKSACPIHAGDNHRAEGDVLASMAQARWLLSRLTE